VTRVIVALSLRCDPEGFKGVLVVVLQLWRWQWGCPPPT
jgi:hypothetical protein